tara:strand:- start:23 stop:202 length:180 start_codon:yes stop_codon:yes gene_type:complete
MVDWLLLHADLYQEGSFGQIATFIGYGAAASVLAVRLSSRFLFKTEVAEESVDSDQSAS